MEFAQATGFSGTISWSPFSLAVLLFGMVVILAGPKKWVLPTFLGLSILMSMALHVVVLGQNLMPHRIFVMCAWARFLARGEFRGLVFSRMDKAFISFCSGLIIIETLRAGVAGFVFSVANSGVDALGSYFLCRVLIRDRDDLLRAVSSLAGVCMVVAGSMCVEFITKHNPLAVLGAVQEFVQVREGRMRCGASFGIPITAGTFGAVLLPLFVACWYQEGRMKKLAVPGCVASTLVTLLAGSAGPLSAYVFAIFALLAWRWRAHMRIFRWSVAISLVALHMVMKAPVWALIARMQVVPGASAYHRFNILDTFINNVDKWWLCGLDSTNDWGFSMDDVANQFCVVAKHGGLLGLFLFIWFISTGFREVGLALKAADDDRPTGIFVWSFGVLLFAHVTSFFGISYYDQTRILWYLNLGMIASVHLLPKTAAEQAGEPETESESALADDISFNPGISQG